MDIERKTKVSSFIKAFLFGGTQFMILIWVGFMIGQSLPKLSQGMEERINLFVGFFGIASIIYQLVDRAREDHVEIRDCKQISKKGDRP